MTALGGELPEDHLPSHVLKELPAWMDEFVKKTIVADADKRWQTADEVLDFLNAAIDEEVHKTIATSHTTSTQHAEKGVVPEGYEAWYESFSQHDTS